MVLVIANRGSRGRSKLFGCHSLRKSIAKHTAVAFLGAKGVE
jgi:hypothetical protein